MHVVDAVVSSPSIHFIELRNVSVIPQSFMLSHTLNSPFYCLKMSGLRSILTGFTYKKNSNATTCHIFCKYCIQLNEGIAP